jgi:DNA invertase Pin-like site-specific DNA recombinase
MTSAGIYLMGYGGKGMATGKFVSYIRVSTKAQGASGLGLEAQKESITRYLNGGNWDLLSEFVEVETGKHADRPQLAKALDHCQSTGATLVIAKLDRLSRDPDFLGMLMKAGTDFIACDMPEANKFMIRIMAALAEKEREMISERTKAALQAAKARGVKLGKPENLTKAAADQGREKGRKAKLAKADIFAAQLSPLVRRYQDQGMSLNGIAATLNADSILTARGKAGSWTPTAVKNLLARA